MHAAGGGPITKIFWKGLNFSLSLKYMQGVVSGLLDPTVSLMPIKSIQSPWKFLHFVNINFFLEHKKLKLSGGVNTFSVYIHNIFFPSLHWTRLLFSIHICLHCCFCMDSHGDSGWDVVNSDLYVNQVNKVQSNAGEKNIQSYLPLSRSNSPLVMT